MQNIPDTTLDKATQQLEMVKHAASGRLFGKSKSKNGEEDKQALFADLFNEHTEMVQDELALAPVSHKEKMLESAPRMKEEEDTKKPASAAGTKAVSKPEKDPVEKDRQSRMTQEDLTKVRDDLKEYGFSDDEIAGFEEQIDSEAGLTWGQFVAAIADKMSDLRKVELSDSQKQQLAGFFGKLGFTEKESDKLITQLEKGNRNEVLKAVQAKIDSLPQEQQLLIDKQDVEAFTSALGISKEFTAKIQEFLGSTPLPKDLKEAFTMLRQELDGMDKKDRQLVRAVGKAFAGVMGETHKASTAATEIKEAVDLKPRAGEEKLQAEIGNEDAENAPSTKDLLPETRTGSQETGQAVAKAVDNKSGDSQAKTGDKQTRQDAQAENENKWGDFFSKLREDAPARTTAAEAKATLETVAKESLAQAQTKVQDKATTTKAWEKVSAPKLMKQVDEAVIKTLKNGAKQLTLQLTPENLGKLSVVLSVQGKEVSATIRAENADAHKIIADNIDIIKQSLEAQGLKVEKLEVQAGLADNQSYRDWFGENEHNLSREREAMIAMRNHLRSMRQSGLDSVAQDVQMLREQAIHADGLHLIA